MGLFGKQNKVRDKVPVIDIGHGPEVTYTTAEVQNKPSAYEDGQSAHVDSLRPRLAGLFEDADADRDQSGYGENVSYDENSSTGRPQVGDGGRYGHLFENPPLRSKPSVKEAVESNAAHVPVTTIANYPDVSKTGPSSLNARWKPGTASDETRRNSDARRMSESRRNSDARRFKDPRPNSDARRISEKRNSDARRSGFLQRTNSISRLARKASLKKMGSSSRSPRSSDNFRIDATAVASDAPGAENVPQPGEFSDFAAAGPDRKIRQTKSSAFDTEARQLVKAGSVEKGRERYEFPSVSPTTPHVNTSVEAGANNPHHVGIAKRSRSFVPGGYKAEPCSPIEAPFGKLGRPFQEDDEDGVLASGRANDVVKLDLLDTLQPWDAEDSSESRVPKGWDSLEQEGSIDGGIFELEAATQYDFYAALDADDRLYNSPSSANGEANAFGQDGEEEASQAIPAPEPVVQETTKPKAKERKRPPPLLSPPVVPPLNRDEVLSEPASATPQSDVFGSNGDFKTGGYKITAEGMVMRPDKTTRQDSDDAPTTGVPLTMTNGLSVRGMSEFRKGPTLGAGAAGRVYLAIHEPSGRSMAIKVVNVYDEAKRNQLLKELDTLSSHVSRFLVRFHGAFYDGTGAVHIALEYMDGGCLSSTVQNFGAIPERVTQMIAVDCLRALRFLHRNKVIHRDFKTANILLSRRLLCAKVSDFGLARDVDPGVSMVDTFVGTVAYMSPERLQGSTYTYASDVWALGISIVECLLGRYPFDRPQSYFDYIDATMSKDMLGKTGADGNKLSPAVIDFVTLCTYSDPQRRPTAAQLLKHPWISGTKRDVPTFQKWMDDLDFRRSKSPHSVKSIQSVRSFLEAGRGPRYGY